MPRVSRLDAGRMFVILNPIAGRFDASTIRSHLARYEECHDGSCLVHEMTEDDDLMALARDAADAGFEIVVAAGGDGTVSAVANGLIGRSAALGILPLGTANVLAQELGIPLEIDAAASLLGSPHRIARVDAMRIAERYAFTQIGVGLDSLMIRDTDSRQKQRFGRLAYLWAGFRRWLGFEPRRFHLVVDEEPMTVRAVQVVLANCRTMGQPPFQWGPDIHPDDGRIALCLIQARTLLDYLVVAWSFLRRRARSSRHIDDRSVTRSVVIETDRPLPVQADGEIVGTTPIQVEVVPSAIGVIVPPESPVHPDKAQEDSATRL